MASDAPALRLVTPATTAVAAGGYLAAVAVVDPFRPSVLQCPVHGITGWWCPGCGSTRAVHALLHGDVGLSLSAHPMVLPLLALMVVLYVRWVRTGDTGTTALPRAIPLAVAAGFVALTVARNVGWMAGPPLLG